MPRFYKMMQSNVFSSENFMPVTLRKLFFLFNKFNCYNDVKP